jgi:TFIIF-interacting CTD phosphatase-like protein
MNTLEITHADYDETTLNCYQELENNEIQEISGDLIEATFDLSKAAFIMNLENDYTLTEEIKARMLDHFNNSEDYVKELLG